MKDLEIRKVADTVLAQIFRGMSFRKSEVRTELAFDGSSYVQVDAHFEHRPNLPASEHVKAMSAMQTKLSETGDDRFVSLTVFSDDEPVEVDEDEGDFLPDTGATH